MEVDCTIPPELLTLQNIDGLHQLEPCGAGCPRPVFSLEQVLVEQLSENRRRYASAAESSAGAPGQDQTLSAIFFSTNALQAAIFAARCRGRRPLPHRSMNTRGVRSVQLNSVDIRACQAERESTQVQREGTCPRHRRCKPISGGAKPRACYRAARILIAIVWRYLISHQDKGRVQDDFACLCRKILRRTGAVLLR